MRIDGRFARGLPSLNVASLLRLALLFVGTLGLGLASAAAETRSLKFYNLHNKETTTVTFKQNGRFLSDGLKKANWVMRDWRRNEPTKMDPDLLDLIWEVYRKSGSRQPIHIVSGYRSPATNSMLRRTRGGQAKKSQHMLGKALDFYLPDVKLSKLRELGLRAGDGGVGYYPKSGSPFVHLDVGSVRHWPRMSRGELVAMFPRGGTMHVPSDGKPLPGYEQAVAAYKSRQRTGASAILTASETSSGGKKAPTLLAALFGGGADDEEDSSPELSKPEPAPKAKAKPEKPAPVIEAAPEEPKAEEPKTLLAALRPRDIPVPAVAPRVAPTPPAPVVAAAAAGNPLDPLGQTDPSTIRDIVNETVAKEEEKPDPFAIVAALAPIPTARPEQPAQPVAISEDIARLAALSAPRADRVPIVETAEIGADQAAVIAALAPKRTRDRESEAAAIRAAFAAQPTVVALSQDAIDAQKALAAAIAVPSLRPVDIVGADQTVVASLAPARASPREALLRAAGLGDKAKTPEAVLKTGVKTAGKASRAPVVAAGSRDPRAKLAPVTPEKARWAIENEKLAEVTGKSPRAPGMARQHIRTAPTEVIALGFDQAPAPDPRRFSGNAVNFLQVARFGS
jgi:uncharacterized protein YcbK (DUF882 family)